MGRKSLHKTANQLIESALNAAQEGAMERHRCFRSFLAIELERFLKFCTANNRHLPKLAENVFVMLSLARSEISWLYQHIDEVRETS
jgi:Membrane-associated apoptosis protein